MDKELLDKSVDELFSLIEKSYTPKQIELEADQYLYDLVDTSAYEEITKEEKAIDYLADYLSSMEYKEWLISTFLN